MEKLVAKLETSIRLLRVELDNLKDLIADAEYMLDEIDEIGDNYSFDGVDYDELCRMYDDIKRTRLMLNENGIKDGASAVDDKIDDTIDALDDITDVILNEMEKLSE